MYIMHFIGLIYTSDFQYAFKDLRIKLPLLVFPLILSSMKPLNKKQFDTVIWFFIGSVFFVTILGVIKFFRRDFVDVRELSVFVSHIRVSLCMVFSIFVLAYYLVKRNYSVIVKAIIVFLIIWFLWQITIWESFISILIIAALVQMVEIVLKKISPALYQALGIFLPLITTNCAVLGVAIMVVTKEFTFGGEAHMLNLGQSVVYAVASALGFGVAMVLFAGIREQLELVSVPKVFKGIPIALITAGILALAFMGFSGLV